MPRNQTREQDSSFVPSVQMDLAEGCEPLNKTFCECLVKYIDILGRKGCNRTAVEFCKLLLALSPSQDPYGVLLRFDFYALRAKEYDMYLNFVKTFCTEVHKSGSLAIIMPNCLLTAGLALHLKSSDEITNNDPLAQAIQSLGEW